MITVPSNIQTEDMLRWWVLHQGVGWWQFQRTPEAAAWYMEPREFDFNPTLHPRDTKGRWAEVPGALSRWRPKGTFFGWDEPVVYVANEPVMSSPDDIFVGGSGELSTKQGVLWKGFLLPDDKLILWFPGNTGPHHAEIERAFADDHPEIDPYVPYFEDGLRLVGVGLPRDRKAIGLTDDVIDVHATTEKLDQLVQRIQRLRKDFEFAESLVSQTYDEREFAWNPSLHPRDPEGRFRYLYHVTDEENFPAIMEQGLTPRTTSMVNEADYPGVYFWTDPADARSWQREGQVVLRVPRDAVETEPDEYGSYLSVTGAPARRARIAIAPELIELETDPARSYAFDPNEPRDARGRWTKIGSRVIPPWKEIIGKKLSFSASEVTMDNLTEDEQGRIRATWEKQTGVPAASVAVNVRDVFRSAEGTPEWEGGLTWYEDAHEFARQRAETHDLTIETMAAVISALSPMTEWNTNKHQADLMVQFYSRDPEHFKSLLPQQAAHEVLAWAKERGEKWPLGAGRRNIVNAARLLQGATPEEVLPQAKTRGFYNSIVDPNNPWDVVVDSHMINVAYGGMTPGAQGLLIEVSKPGSADVWGDVVTPEGADYTARPPFSWFGSPKVRGRDVGVIPIIADAVRAAAAEWNEEHPDQPLSPMQVQAITWVQWLKLHPAQEKRKAVKESQRATVAALRLAGVTA